MPAFIHGWSLVRQGKIDLIYSTGGAWSAHLAGLWLKKTTGLPWVAEIHDPLVIRKRVQTIRVLENQKIGMLSFVNI